MKKVANVVNVLWYVVFWMFPNPDTHNWLGLGYQFFYCSRRDRLITWLQSEQKRLCIEKAFQEPQDKIGFLKVR
jgi:hypothetical protein